MGKLGAIMSSGDVLVVMPQSEERVRIGLKKRTKWAEEKAENILDEESGLA